MITVSMDYRLGALGFMVSDQLRQAGALNLGLQDQRLVIGGEALSGTDLLSRDAEWLSTGSSGT